MVESPASLEKVTTSKRRRIRRERLATAKTLGTATPEPAEVKKLGEKVDFMSKQLEMLTNSMLYLSYALPLDQCNDPHFMAAEVSSAPPSPSRKPSALEVQQKIEEAIVGARERANKHYMEDDLFGVEGEIKTQLLEGTGCKNAEAGDEAILSRRAEAADGALLVERNDFEYTIGSDMLGKLEQACDKALTGMKKAEEGALQCSKQDAYGEKTPDGAMVMLSPKEIYETKDVSFARDKSVMKKQVTEGDGYDEDFEKAKDTWSMSEEETIDYGTDRKERGTTLFKAGRHWLAIECYKKVGELFSNIDNMKDANKAKATELKKAAELNKAMCYLKVKDFAQTKKSCNTVLKDDSRNIKALYRLAQAEFGLKNYDEATRNCLNVIDVDAHNKDAHALLKQVLSHNPSERLAANAAALANERRADAILYLSDLFHERMDNALEKIKNF